MVKLTELGYPVVSDEVHEKLFGKEQPKEMDRDQRYHTEELLRRFDIKIPVDYPDNLYDGKLPLPGISGERIKDHFEKVAEEQVGHYKRFADFFAKCKLPRIPKGQDFILQPGWTRYEWLEDKGSFRKEQVEYPLEDAFTFDTETFVHEGAYPIIGTALSDKAAYIWLASELIIPTLEKEKWDQFGMIPIGKGKFIAGHNISYDRIRTQEAYDLSNTEPENFFFDTLSAHVGVSGLASGQRWFYALKGKNVENLTDEERGMLKRNPAWYDEGSTNSLVECYNFHVVKGRSWFDESEVEPLDMGDKAIRDVFVKSKYMYEITAVLDKALEYAVKDAFYTAELFKEIWPKYLKSTPSMVALCGHYHLNGSIVPLVDDWFDWIENTEKVFNDYNQEMTDLCKKLMWGTYNEWKGIVESCEDRMEGYALADEWVKKDPWISQLDWFVKTEKGKYAGVPNWVRDYIKDPGKNIGTKSILAHLLLKLKYEGSPLVFTKGSGWTYKNEEGEVTKVPHPKGTGENVGGLITRDFVVDLEVGRLNSDLPEAKRALEISNAVSYWTSVRSRVINRIAMVASNPYGEDSLVTLPEILCHGTVTRRTVESLFATMCSTKSWRIGTELKTRVRAPEGWKVVGADFDGQEVQVASIYSDCWEGHHIGCSPFGYNVLSGSKDSGTDPHTALAKAIFPELYASLAWDSKLGVCDKDPDSGELTPLSNERKKELSKARDLAKVINFTALYGGASKAIQTYIKKVYPDKSPEEVKVFAERALSSKKGKKVTKKGYNGVIKKVLDEGVYEGGSDSGCFNYMESIAIKSDLPTLPCLGTRISTALRPSKVGKEFVTGRVNWSIQSSGAEILSIILTSIHWLAKEYKIPCRFILSIHDEVWFMTPEKYAEQFAVVFQIAHMYTWSLFHSQVGIPELPLSRAYFSSVAIDDRVRKSPKECTVTPSNPNGAEEPNGVEHSMSELAEIGAVTKLTTRYNAIKNNLI
jgi:DNA polymerase gamma 1